MKDLVNDPKNHLIDVRTPGEYAETSLEGSQNIPLDTVPDRVEDFKKMAETGDLVLFCRSGARSENAKAFLKQQGVTNVHNAGGLGDVRILKM